MLCFLLSDIEVIIPYIHTHTHTYTHIHTHTHTYTHIHTYIHTYILIHRYIQHTLMLVCGERRLQSSVLLGGGEGVTVKCGEVEEREKERVEEVGFTKVTWCTLDTRDSTYNGKK